MDNTTIEFEALPPERKIQAAQLNCGTCCCCCCLHSLGGLIGTSMKTAELTELDKEAAEECRCAVNGVYWPIFFIGSLIGVFALDMGFVIVALFLPLFQLAASIIAALAIQKFSAEPRDAKLRVLGRMTLGTIGGTLIGLALMFPLMAFF